LPRLHRESIESPGTVLLTARTLAEAIRLSLDRDRAE